MNEWIPILSFYFFSDKNSLMIEEQYINSLCGASCVTLFGSVFCLKSNVDANKEHECALTDIVNNAEAAAASLFTLRVSSKWTVYAILCFLLEWMWVCEMPAFVMCECALPQKIRRLARRRGTCCLRTTTTTAVAQFNDGGCMLCWHKLGSLNFPYFRNIHRSQKTYTNTHKAKHVIVLRMQCTVDVRMK